VWEHLYQILREKTGLTIVETAKIKALTKKPKASVEAYLQRLKK
jgi:hypothetical protein